MAETVVSLPLPQANNAASLRVDNPAEARKRRREILSSHRNTAATPDTSSSASTIVVATASEVAAPNKKRRVSANSDELPVVVSPTTAGKKTVISKITGKAKKPQMKYDPEVPMTKEEAAAWRREQRRKRNRESAAASRQRQRDRIVELEAEVDEWKAKFDEAMKRIQELEKAAVDQPASSDVPVPAQEISSSSVPEDVSLTQEPQVNMETEEGEGINIQSPEELVEEVFRDTTILISPSNSPRSVSPTGSATIDFSQVQAVKVVSNVGGSSVSSVEEQAGEEPKPSKMISRQA